MRTGLGRYHVGESEELLRGRLGRALRGKVQLLITSPPFPLNRKKSYGNLDGETYKAWFMKLAPLFADLLTPTGSIVIEMGNAWMPGRPVQSLLHLEALMGFVNSAGANLRLCQEFICYNPSRLPSPAQWVTVKRTRATDSFTHVWWMSKTDRPKADNRRVLRPYSRAMMALLDRQSYNHGKRPSGHEIGRRSFLTDHGGSIAQNVFELDPIVSGELPRLPNAFRIGNAASNDFFLRRCREKGIRPHPARMPPGLVSFFVNFLTTEGDLVVDPFGGSNTTGFVAELAKRRWVSIEKDGKYLAQSKLRFQDPRIKEMRKPRGKRPRRKAR